MEPIQTPHLSPVFDIEEDWIDFNGHLNMAFYNVLFDRASDEVFVRLGMGPAYASSRRLTTYAAEMHICYVRELHLEDRVNVTWQLLDHDDKRLHAFQELRHVDGWLAATCESMTLHIDMSGPRVTRFPSDVASKIETVAAAHSSLSRPHRAGRAIGIRRKKE